MSVVCVIPARGGSKGVPRKNLREVGGVPLIDRAVLTVARSGVADEIVVSTDDDEIAARAASLGATLVRRPDELASDDASSESALIHALSTVGRTGGRLLFVQTTTPLLEPADLVALRDAHEGHDSSLTVSEFHGFLWRDGADRSLVGINHDARRRVRRQDLGHAEYLENGAAYLMDVAGFLAARHRFFGRIACSVMPRIRSLEVDDHDDLLLVRQVHEMLARSGR